MANRDRTINYVELTVPDLAAAKRFYGGAFGWGFTDYGDAYVAFSPETAGLDGGFRPGQPAQAPPGGPLVILYADDLEAMQGRIESAGGRVTVPIFAFPGGRRFHFADPFGNELAVWSE